MSDLSDVEIPIVPAWATDAQKAQGLLIEDTRTYNALIHHGIETAAALTVKSGRELIAEVKQLGKKAIPSIESALAARGLKLMPSTDRLRRRAACPQCSHEFYL